MDYLLPKEVVQAVVRYGVTGISAVPPIWNQLAVQEWLPEAVDSCATSPHRAALATLDKLRPVADTGIFQMYGLTEAFAAAPGDHRRPGSVGRALPNVELVVREDGSRCAPDEPGELVHRGSLVMGYWNDEERTRERFRKAPGQPYGVRVPEIAVWSGDQMTMDAEGYLYFVSRRDEMIKTSGYRVSPTEVEEVVFESGLVPVALGVVHPELGQAIVLLVEWAGDGEGVERTLVRHCQKELPSFMVPAHVEAPRICPEIRTARSIAPHAGGVR